MRAFNAFDRIFVFFHPQERTESYIIGGVIGPPDSHEPLLNFICILR